MQLMFSRQASRVIACCHSYNIPPVKSFGKSDGIHFRGISFDWLCGCIQD